MTVARVLFAACAASVALASPVLGAETIVAEPETPISSAPPDRAPPMDVQISLAVVVDKEGRVESAVETSRTPPTAQDAYAEAAISRVRAARFHPSTRDGVPIRSRIDWVVVFRAPEPAVVPAAGPTPAPKDAVSSDEQDEDYAEVEVRGTGWSSPRGVSDVRVRRELLDAAPHAQTSEMLSAAPGFFVDHEDGEGLGNDVYLRGFDLDHGSGIEMRVGSIPLNSPSHVQGQGYVDVNFVIPEVVRSVRVLEGPYDPRQGDAAIVGSAYFDLGVLERGYRIGTSYGSFGQTRVVGIAAPRDADEETFAAFSMRHTDGFGARREARSGSVLAQYGVDLGKRDHLRLLATAHGAHSESPGVVRQDDSNAGRVDYYGGYPFYTDHQGVQSSRVILGLDFDHVEPGGSHFEIAPFVIWTDFLARQNFTGSLETSRENPAVGGLGDLIESVNGETAFGATSRFHAAPVSAGPVELAFEPGVFVRAGRTEQARSLVDPNTLARWDRRLDAHLGTLDAGAYADLDVRIEKRLRVSGGVRADLLVETVDDRLATGAVPGARRDVAGTTVGPRVTLEYALFPSLTPVASYGEGFRSLDAAHLRDGASRPYSKVRSFELGLRTGTAGGRYTASAVVFETRVGNELVFSAAEGGLETERGSTRRGVLASIVTSPVDFLLASTALSITRSTFETNLPGIAHYVPNVPSIVFRADATVRGRVATIGDVPIQGRIGAGYTLLGPRHLTDDVVGPTVHVLNASAALRGRALEVGLEAYNVLDLRYADESERYVSNLQTQPGRARASVATHTVAAPPRTVLGSLTLYF